jgi:hypothetical protein
VNEDFKWIKALGLGDTVITVSVYGESIGIVSRVNPKTLDVLVRGGTSRFMRDNGRQRGPFSYEAMHLEPATPEAMELVRVKVRLKKLANVKFNELSDDQVRRMLKIAREKPEAKAIT